MLICAKAFSGTSQGSQPSTEISFRLPLNCEKQFLWFKGSHMYYFSCLSPFLKTSGMVRWFWCLSPLFTSLMCCSFSPFHLAYKPSSVMSCFQILYPCTLGCCCTSEGVCISLRRETRAAPANTALATKLQQHKPCPAHTCCTGFCKCWDNKQLWFLKGVFPYHHSRLPERWI